MGDRGVSEDAEILKRALGKHAAECVREFAESLTRQGKPTEAARWRRIAATLQEARPADA
jgi:hypothetical protein